MEHHKTRIPFLYGYVDSNNSTIEGWLINIRMRSGVNTSLFRAIQEKNKEEIPIKYGITRTDVKDVYNLVSADCGFKIPRTDLSSAVYIQIYMFEEWKNVMEIPAPAPTHAPTPTFAYAASPSQNVPEDDKMKSNLAMKRDVIIIDEFYDNPDLVRQMALKGTNNFLLKEVKSFIEMIVGGKIVTWDASVNGSFDLSNAERLVEVCGNTNLHMYYANIFLTPNAPINAGLTLYKSKDTQKRQYDPIQHNKVSRDLTRFEVIDKVGNVYNRLVVWNANLLHSPSCYFGNSKDNARLVQTFAFQVTYA